MNPVPIKDWGLNKKAEEKVRANLGAWLEMLIEYANGKEGNVFRADTIKKELFFFTDCKDILSKNPESKAVETAKEIRIRKRYVMMQLLVKNIIDGPIKRTIKCTHCGYEDVYIDSLSDLGGHYKFCAKCGKTDLCIYPNIYDSVMSTLKKDLLGKGLLRLKELN